MKAIYKYVMTGPEGSGQCIQMPKNAKILHVADQRNQLCLWAEVDTEQPLEERSFFVAATGQDISFSKSAPRQHLGTVLMFHGELVLHVYEVGK